MVVDNFKLCREGGDFYFINPKVTNFLKDIIAPDPTLIEEKCIGCNRCAEVCLKTICYRYDKKEGKKYQFGI